jgi:hypothetical protein
MTFIGEAQPGKMRHTFTGIKTMFANYLLHKIINECIRPFRVELMRRTEGGGETQLSETLRTYMLDEIQNLRTQIQLYAFTAVPDPEVTLADRKKRRDEYINRMLDKKITAEEVTREEAFTHSDEVLEPSDAAYWTVTFDYTGQFDKDMAQPTPERVQNDLLREVIVALDKLVVKMTRSHSSDSPRTILAQEAVDFITDLDLVYQVIDSYDPGKVPFRPTAISLNERENFFNADGTFDPNVTDGSATGEMSTDTRRGVQPTGTNALS